MASGYPELDYVSDRFVGSLDLNGVKAWEDWLKGSQVTTIPFDASYIAYLAKYHGGQLRDGYFKTKEGTEHVVINFYHFDRTLSRSDPRCCDLSSRVWSDTSDRLGGYLMPFAELAFGDMACFDYRQPGRPSVVVWFHEEWDEDEGPKTEFVAENFDEFLNLLAKYQQERHPRTSGA